jgi:4-alpha-glucanotransferase
VLGFYRIFSFPWRPQLNAEFLPLTKEEAMLVTGGELPRFQEHDDETPEGKAANRAQGEAFLRVLLEETGNYRLVGEDLGTVPDYVRPSLLSLQIPGFRIPFWEHTPDKQLVPGAKYDRLSVAAFATHDHEPLRALWERWMQLIEDALHRPQELAAERDHTWREVRQFSAWAGFEVPRITAFDAVHTKFLAALFRSNSWLAICMITDLFGTTQRFNVPGAVSEANWSQRLATPIKDWRNDEALNEKMAHVRSILAQTGRLA